MAAPAGSLASRPPAGPVLLWARGSVENASRARIDLGRESRTELKQPTEMIVDGNRARGESRGLPAASSQRPLVCVCTHRNLGFPSISWIEQTLGRVGFDRVTLCTASEGGNVASRCALITVTGRQIAFPVCGRASAGVMTTISYAKNFEDVMLLRALGG